MGIFRALGFIIVLYALSNIFNSAFIAFEGAATQTFKTFEAAAIQSQRQFEQMQTD